MTRFRTQSATVAQMFVNLFTLLLATSQYLALCLQPKVAVAAENLFLREQLALYQERRLCQHCELAHWVIRTVVEYRQISDHGPSR